MTCRSPAAETQLLHHTLLARGAMLGLLLVLGACRANDQQCRELAQRVVVLADAEGKAGAATAAKLESDCVALRPSKRLVACILAAESLAAIDDC